jgi:predicted RNase H-like nuclease
MSWVAGVDGCKHGWFAVFFEPEKIQHHADRFDTLRDVVDARYEPVVLAVDIPIGLLKNAEKGGRECDRIARRLLRQPRASSVFSPPVWTALPYETNYRAALRANRASSPLRVGIPKQCHALFPKIREANALPSNELNKRIFEVHPELCFYEINDGKALRHSKKAKNGVGIEERCKVLRRTIFRNLLSEILAERPPGVSKDDALDAIAACWSAIRIQAIPRQSIPTNEKPPTIWR